MQGLARMNKDEGINVSGKDANCEGNKIIFNSSFPSGQSWSRAVWRLVTKSQFTSCFPLKFTVKNRKRNFGFVVNSSKISFILFFLTFPMTTWVALINGIYCAVYTLYMNIACIAQIQTPFFPLFMLYCKIKVFMLSGNDIVSELVTSCVSLVRTYSLDVWSDIRRVCCKGSFSAKTGISLINQTLHFYGGWASSKRGNPLKEEGNFAVFFWI